MQSTSYFDFYSLILQDFYVCINISHEVFIDNMTSVHLKTYVMITF